MNMEAVFKHLSTSLQRELDFCQEVENIGRMQTVLTDYDRLAVPSVYRELSTSRLLVMEEIQGGPIAQAPEGQERIEAARQLLESFYKQIVVDGFFHADPHPGNLMWWKNRIYILDFGMVGAIDASVQGTSHVVADGSVEGRCGVSQRCHADDDGCDRPQ